MRFIAIIPARYASTRFPGKPLAKINGVTMIERVYRRVAQVFDDLCVATDDQRIAQQVERFGGRVVLTRGDHPSGTDRVAEALEKLGGQYDVVVNVQGDEPFIAPDQLLQLRSLFDDPKTDIATLIKPLAADEDIFDANCVKAVVGVDGFALYFSRYAIPFQRGVDQSQWACRHQYFRHIGLYGYRTEVLEKITQLPAAVLEKCESLEQLRWLENGYRIKTAVTTCPSYGVDTPQDLEKIEKMNIV